MKKRIKIGLLVGLLVSMLAACDSSSSDRIVNSLLGDLGDLGVYSKTATAGDFVGPWSGTSTLALTHINGTYPYDLTISNNTGTLTGTDGDGGTLIGSVTNGVWNYTRTLDSYPAGDCDGYSVTGTAALSEDLGTLTFSESGTYCGEGSPQTGTITGTLTPVT